MNVLQRLILRDHPDYDFEQYHFRAGDMVKSLDGDYSLWIILHASMLRHSRW